MRHLFFVLLLNCLITVAAFAQDSLHDAVQKDDFQQVRSLIQQGTDVNLKDKAGFTPLAYAISSNASAEILDYLLANGASVPITDENKTWTQPSALLLGAASLGQTGQAALLISRGADINVSTNTGTTPLHMAAMDGHLDTMQLLADKGANMHALTTNGLTPLMTALIQNQLQAAGWLAQMQGLTMHRSESDICLADDKMKSLVSGFGSLWMNLSGPAIPVSLNNKSESGSMRSDGFSGMLSTGALLGLGTFEYDSNGIACIKKGGFLVLPAGSKIDEMDNFIQTIDAGYHDMVTGGRSKDIRERLRLVDHYAAVGNMERSAQAGRDGPVKVEWLGPLPPQSAEPVFTGDGRHIAFAVKQGEREAVVVDGRPGPAFDAIGKGRISLSSDGKHVAYGALTGVYQFVVKDGKRGPAFERVGKPVLSYDGSHVAYVAEQGNNAFAIVDGIQGPEYDAIGDIVFSSDGKRVAYSAKKAGKVVMVVDGKPGQQHDRIGKDMTAFSPDGQRILYVAANAGKFSVIVDGHAGQGCEGFMAAPVFSPDSKHIAYAALRDGKRFIVMDDKWTTDYDDYGFPVFSPDSKRLAYGAAQAKKQFVIVDGREGRKHDGISDIVFSPNGKSLAYFAEDDKIAYVVVDGQMGSKYPRLAVGTLRFSPDGKHMAYFATSEEKKPHVVIDGHDGPEFDGIGPGGPTFNADGTLEYLASKDGVLYRIRHLNSKKK